MKHLLCFICLLLFIHGHAQDTMRIQLRSKVQKDAILLRWAPNTPLAWKNTNRSGFRIERYTVVRDTMLLERPEKVVIGHIPVTARLLNDWIPLLETNENAGIIAQALYGDEFQLTGEDAQGITRIINLAQELEQRFIFSLHAADQDFKMACMAGWGWRDTTVRLGEKYLYRVIPATPEDSMRIEYGGVYVSLDEYTELPVPEELSGIWGDKSVMISWDYGRLSAHYNSYYIEKSLDGKEFTQIEGRPVSNMNETEERSMQRLYYADSLSDNQQTYYYRIRGVSAFGELSPPSAVLSGKGMVLLRFVPGITRAVVNDHGELELEWEFNEEGNSQIKGFELNQSEEADGVYVAAVKEILPESRRLVYKDLYPTNYFTIRAVAKEGKSSVSYPVLVQPLDSIPPARPEGLTGKVDSLGVVLLTWNKNREKDLLGYIVYRTYRAGDEPMPLFDRALGDTCFFDTVEVVNLNSSVYYYLAAVDQRYNHSALTPPLALRKPDVIPPVSPLVKDYKVTPAGIEIIWIPSPDEDVKEHVIYRKEKKAESMPELVFQGQENRTDRFTDTTVWASTVYEYSIYAVDQSGLRSEPTPAVTIASAKASKQVIQKFDAVVDKEHLLVKLLWISNLENVSNYEIYRGEGEAPVSLWKILSGWEREVLDEHVLVSTKYTYILRALFQDGGNSSIKQLEIQM